MTDKNNVGQFIISIESYENKALDLDLTLHIRSAEESPWEFEALLMFNYEIKIEPDLYPKDAYKTYIGIEVKKNTALPENELDFFKAYECDEIDEYSPVAQQLTEQVAKYLSGIRKRIIFKIVLNPEKVEQA